MKYNFSLEEKNWFFYSVNLYLLFFFRMSLKGLIVVYVSLMRTWDFIRQDPRWVVKYVISYALTKEARRQVENNCKCSRSSNKKSYLLAVLFLVKNAWQEPFINGENLSSKFKAITWLKYTHLWELPFWVCKEAVLRPSVLAVFYYWELLWTVP